ncbi:hypothetical protein KIN20_032395 [Parelaphostrongylus tenuis]|uniref:Uncharacterized protein n=1 Tax=Parelaphostrongylus tenuis TaxID=148309 RepID=A0AAD5WI14_PARTN|nr:hypothetical protein KIN20_032395 [Parelaphostrongylus tenuis]
MMSGDMLRSSSLVSSRKQEMVECASCFANLQVCRRTFYKKLTPNGWLYESKRAEPFARFSMPDQDSSRPVLKQSEQIYCSHQLQLALTRLALFRAQAVFTPITSFLKHPIQRPRIASTWQSEYELPGETTGGCT